MAEGTKVTSRAQERITGNHLAHAERKRDVDMSRDRKTEGDTKEMTQQEERRAHTSEKIRKGSMLIRRTTTKGYLRGKKGDSLTEDTRDHRRQEWIEILRLKRKILETS